MRRVLTLLLLCGGAGLAGCATTPRPPVQAAPEGGAEPAVRAWTMLGPQGTVARAIVNGDGSSCPELMVDGAAQPMTARSAPETCFDVLVCEGTIPAGAARASIGATRLPLLPRELKRIAILGDTGCRLKASSCPQTTACQPSCEATSVQACNDPDQWPFARVAELAAKAKPDLVLHVGDYHYREALCPAGNAGCAGSPAGDNWPSWKADFFAPAAPLLAAAPWVFVRGNHEECDRAGAGWFRFLEPGPPPADCNDDPSPYSISLPELQLLVLNTSIADSSSTQPGFYAPSYQELNQLASQGSSASWLLSHHPLWAFSEYKGEMSSLTGVLQQAVAQGPGSLDPKISFVLAGHLHLFEALSFSASPPRVPITVFGMSGTKLDDPIQMPLVGQTIDGVEVTAAEVRDDFGYAIAEPEKGGWKLTVFDVRGNAKVHCRLQGTALECTEKE